MKPSAVLPSIALLLTCSLAACKSGSGVPTAPAIVVVDSAGGAHFSGRLEMKLNENTGQLEPYVWKEGNLFFFRTASETGDGFLAKPGTIYRVNKHQHLVEAGTFDVSAPTEQLVATHVEK